MWWSGAGILAILFPAATVFVSYQIGGYPGVPVGFLGAALATWFVGHRLNRVDAADRAAGPKQADENRRGGTGAVRDAHRLWSIPMQYWAFLWLLFALSQIVLMLLGEAGWQQD